MDIEIETAGSSHTELQTRGIALNRLLRQAVAHRTREYRGQFPGFVGGITVRLFPIAEASAGLDKGCLVSAELAPGQTVVVGSDINGDTQRAIHSAFTKLERATRSTLERLRRQALAPPRLASSGVAA